MTCALEDRARCGERPDPATVLIEGIDRMPLSMQGELLRVPGGA